MTKGTTQLWIHKKNTEPVKHLLQLDAVDKSLLSHELTGFSFAHNL